MVTEISLKSLSLWEAPKENFSWRKAYFYSSSQRISASHILWRNSVRVQGFPAKVQNLKYVFFQTSLLVYQKGRVWTEADLHRAECGWTS